MTAPDLDYLLAFTTGLLASGHCVGMCGSLVSAYFIRFGDGGRLMPYVSYHASRITVYALAGAVAALVGAALVSTGLLGKGQAILQIVAGLVVILLGLEVLGLSPLRLGFLKVPAGLFRAVFLAAGRRGPVVGAAMAGGLNGLMPCALTLAMAFKATTAPTPLHGALLLAAFGLGTLPSMLFVSAVFGKLGARLRGLLLKAAAVFVIGLGVATTWQGVAFFSIVRKLPNW